MRTVRNSKKWLWLCSFALSLSVSACHTPGHSCLDLRADVSLNLYEGQPHATNLYIYPLSDSLAFGQTSADALLGGAKPAGMTQPDPLQVTIFPGQQDIELDQQFAENTKEIGVLADYYRERGDAEGTRTTVVRAICGRRTPRLYMSVSDLRVE